MYENKSFLIVGLTDRKMALVLRSQAFYDLLLDHSVMHS